jgi:hypothetical protein
MLWSFGRCGYQDAALLDVMHAVADKLAATRFDSATLADVVAAEAQLGWADQRLADLVSNFAQSRIGRFDAPHLAQLIAGLASVG